MLCIVKIFQIKVWYFKLFPMKTPFAKDNSEFHLNYTFLSRKKAYALWYGQGKQQTAEALMKC